MKIPPSIKTILRQKLFLLFGTGSFFGSFERVDLGVINLDIDFDVGGKVADSADPFLGRRWISAANLTDRAGHYALAPFTVFGYSLTGTIRKYTPLFPPKGTLGTCKYGLTLHITSS